MQRFYKIFIVLFIGVGLFILLNTPIFAALLKGDIGQLEEMLDSNSPTTFFLLIFLMIFQNGFSIFPFLILSTIAVADYGLWGGFFVSWFGSFLGAVVAFSLVRYLLHDSYKEKLYHKPKIQKWDHIFRENSLLVIVGARTIPIFPDSIINIAAGISTISLKSYVIATLIGKFNLSLLFALLGEGFFQSDKNPTLLILVLVGYLFVLAILLYWWTRRTKKEKVWKRYRA